MMEAKLVRLVRRMPDLAPDAFHARWRDRQSALVRRLPGVRRYVQSHALLQGYAKGPLLFDGIDEFWFESADAMRAARKSSAWTSVEANLAEFSGECVTIPVDVHVIKDNPIPASAVKNIEFVNRRPGVDLHSFRRYWRETHGPIASHIPPLVRYEQYHLALEVYEGAAPAFDGLAITWFRSTADMRAGAATQAYAKTRADEPNFLADGHLPIIITREVEIDLA